MAIGVPNPWMAVGQASLVLAMLFIIDGGISAWRRGEGARSLAGERPAGHRLDWHRAGRLGVLGLRSNADPVTPLFLLLALVIGAELSLGLPPGRAGRARPCA